MQAWREPHDPRPRKDKGSSKIQDNGQMLHSLPSMLPDAVRVRRDNEM